MIKTLRKVGGFFGKFVDADDRKALGFLITWSGAIGLVLVSLGGSLGLAWRLFEVLRG